MTAVPLLWINGFPGSGKLSVARELVKLSGNEMILIDNHQLIDPVEARIPRGHPDYQTERQLQRSITFHEFVAKTGVRSQIIFTGKTSTTVHLAFLKSYMKIFLSSS